MNLLFLFALLSSLYTLFDVYFDFKNEYKVSILLLALVVPVLRVTSDITHFILFSKKSKIKRLKKGLSSLILGEYFEAMQDKYKLEGGSIYCNPFINDTSRCTHNNYINGSNFPHYSNQNNLSRKLWESWTKVVLPKDFKSDNERILYRSIGWGLKRWDKEKRIIILKRLNKIIESVKCESPKIYTLKNIFEEMELEENDREVYVLNSDKAYFLKILIQLNCSFNWFNSNFEAELEYESLDINLKRNDGIINFDFGYKSVNRLSISKPFNSEVIQHFMDIMDEIVQNKRKCCFVSKNAPQTKETFFNVKYQIGHCLSCSELVESLYEGERFQMKRNETKEINFEGEDVVLENICAKIYGKEYMGFFCKLLTLYKQKMKSKLDEAIFESKSYTGLLLKKMPKMDKSILNNAQYKRFVKDISWSLTELGAGPLFSLDWTLSAKRETQKLYKSLNIPKIQNLELVRKGYVNIPLGIRKYQTKEEKCEIKERINKGVSELCDDKQKGKLSKKEKKKESKKMFKNLAKQKGGNVGKIAQVIGDEIFNDNISKEEKIKMVIEKKVLLNSQIDNSDFDGKVFNSDKAILNLLTLNPIYPRGGDPDDDDPPDNRKRKFDVKNLISSEEAARNFENKGGGKGRKIISVKMKNKERESASKEVLRNMKEKNDEDLRRKRNEIEINSLKMKIKEIKENWEFKKSRLSNSLKEGKLIHRSRGLKSKELLESCLEDKFRKRMIKAVERKNFGFYEPKLKGSWVLDLNKLVENVDEFKRLEKETDKMLRKTIENCLIQRNKLIEDLVKKIKKMEKFDIKAPVKKLNSQKEETKGSRTINKNKRDIYKKFEISNKSNNKKRDREMQENENGETIFNLTTFDKDSFRIKKKRKIVDAPSQSFRKEMIIDLKYIQTKPLFSKKRKDEEELVRLEKILKGRKIGKEQSLYKYKVFINGKNLKLNMISKYGRIKNIRTFILSKNGRSNEYYDYIV